MWRCLKNPQRLEPGFAGVQVLTHNDLPQSQRVCTCSTPGLGLCTAPDPFTIPPPFLPCPRTPEAVFPALQGGPHNATIGALAFQLREALFPAQYWGLPRWIAWVAVVGRAVSEGTRQDGGSQLVDGCWF